MPGIDYPPDTVSYRFSRPNRPPSLHLDCQPWAIPHQALARNMRQYATLMGLNSDDDEPEYPNITSYSTRVEKIYKAPGSTSWTVTLRRLEVLPYTGGKLRAAWWTEDFDAVVVSTGDFDAPYVPDTPGLAEWARAHPERIYHARQYRSPEAVRGKVNTSYSTCLDSVAHSLVYRTSLSLEEPFLPPKSPVISVLS